jgi:sulfate/thiosulfate transport system permease protein
VATDTLSTRRFSRRSSGTATGRPALAGVLSTAYLSIVVLLPIAALVSTAATGSFFSSITAPEGLSALKFTVVISLIVAVIDSITGLAIAWVLVRDDFPGKKFVNALIDLPFALPTIVAGLTLLALYGKDSPVGIDVSSTRIGVLLALLFVTLPFVVRAVQPVLGELERDVEEAAASLGAKPFTVFRRVILPSLRSAILSGAGLAFARSLGEFGAIILISGNLPYKTEMASVFIFNQLENGNQAGAAAVSVVLLVASFLLLLGLRALANRGRRREG